MQFRAAGARQSSSPSKVERKLWAEKHREIFEKFQLDSLFIFSLTSAAGPHAVGINSAQEEKAAFPPPLSSHFR